MSPSGMTIESLHRQEFYEYAEAAYREAIVNAVIHRDYFANGEVAVEKHSDHIFIDNPGVLPKGLTANDFGKNSRPRNRLLTDLLLRTPFMDRLGTGIKRINDAYKQNNNHVEFNFNKYNFDVAIHTNETDKYLIINRVHKI